MRSVTRICLSTSGKPVRFRRWAVVLTCGMLLATSGGEMIAAQPTAAPQQAGSSPETAIDAGVEPDAVALPLRDTTDDEGVTATEEDETAADDPRPPLSPALPDIRYPSPGSAEKQAHNALSRPSVHESVEALYHPVGLRRGAFLFYPALEIAGIFTDNVFASNSDRQWDQGLELRGGVHVLSDWSRHALAFEIGGQRQVLQRFDKEAERAYHARLRGRLDITSRTQLSARLSHDFSTEARSSRQLPQDAAERTRIRTDDLELELSQRFNRLTLALRGGLTRLDYDDVRLNDGTWANNDDRDYSERRLGLRARFRLSQRLVLLADGLLNRRDYRQRVDDNGFIRGSDGFTLSAGVELTYSDKLRGRLTAGYAHQSPDDPRLAQVQGPLFEADLEYRASALTTMQLRAATALEESILADSGGVLRRTYAIELSHALRRHWLLLVGLGYDMADYQGTDLAQNRLSVTLGSDYYFNRNTALSLRYAHDRNDGNDRADRYTSNRLHLGLKLRR